MRCATEHCGSTRKGNELGLGTKVQERCHRCNALKMPAAAVILMTSPSRKGATASAQVAEPLRCRKCPSQAAPRTKIGRLATVLATSADRKRDVTRCIARTTQP